MSRNARAVFVALAAAAAAALVVWLSRERPPASTPGSGAADSAAVRASFARVAGECAVAFDEGEARVISEAVALAALADSGAADCRGSIITQLAAEARGVSVMTAPVSGPAELVEEAGIASSVVARIAVGSEVGGCGAPRGLIALVAVRGNRLEIDALGHWTGSCGAIEPLSIASGDGGVVLLEPIEQQQPNEDEPVRKLAVWRRVGRDLVRAETIAE